MDHEQMPMWAPPTPPHDDNDVYIDETLFFLYEPTVMPETQLPPVYVKKEKKKIKVESITTRKQKQRKEEQPRVPRSLFDRPTAQLLKLRRDAKFQKMKLGQMKPYRPLPTLPPKPVMDQTVDHPEWLIHEDWALLQAVQSFFDVPLNLMIVNPAHTPNWDMVADVVNSCSRVYRSTKQCRLRYENVIIPREEGRIMYDMNPRKQKKQKGIYKMAKTNRAMKTGQIHSQDSNNGLTILYSLRFDSVKSIATKRPPTMRQTLVNPTLKNPKHASVLQENSITYDQPLNPMQVAEIRAQRIQREKKQNQQQQAAAAAATDQQTTVAVAPVVGGVQRATQQVAVPQVQVSTPTIVAMTTAVTPTQLATIGTAVSSATVLTVTGTPLGQATIRQRAPLTVQEISSGATVVGQMTSVSQVRAQLQTGTTTVTTALTPVQLAQRFSGTTTLSSGATVQQQLQAAAAGKTTALTQQQLQLLQQQTLLQRQKQQHHMVQQQQLRTMQKLTLPADALRQQQQLRQLKGPVPVIQGQKTVIAQQLVTSMGQPVKQGQLKMPAGTLTRALTQEDMVRFKHQQQQLNQQLNQQKIATGQAAAGTSVTQIHHQQAGQLQITGTPLQQVSQALSKVSGQQAGATLVKTVTAPAGSVTIPSNVSINVSMPQKGVAKVSQLNPQQMHLLQRGKQTIPVQKGIGQKVNAPQMLNAVQIIQQQSGGRGLTIQQLHQLMKQQPQGATIQQIIHTSQPTIIATVTQSQATPQMVTKVMATSSTVQPSQMQTISASPVGGAVASGSTGASQSVTLAQVPMPSLNITSIAPGQSSMTASIVKPGSVSGVEAVTTVQIHPVTSITQSKLTGVTQNVVVQPMQSVQHVTVPAPVSQQTHMQVAGQQMTVSAPTGASQTLQMTVPTSPHVQAQVQHVTLSQTPPTHVTVTAQRGPTFSQASPITVTVTPTAPVQSPVHTPTQSAQQHTPVSHMGTPPTQSHIVSSLSQPITVSEQTVTTILQSQRTPTQPTVQVQHTPTPSQQPTTQTIHIQSPSVPQTGIQSTLTGQSQSSSTSPQTTLQGKYSMRTRNQSKPQ